MKSIITLLLLTSVFSCLIHDIKTVHIGLIRNASLALTYRSVNVIINETKCDYCLCQILRTDGFSSIVSFNCYIIKVNEVSCELFTQSSYLASSSYRLDVNRNSTFYFVELPTMTPIIYGINLVVNGDAETGPCSTTEAVVLPTSWSAVSPITQISYTNNADTLTNTTPGPSNRGNCFFAGGLGMLSNMSQMINVTMYADIIDSNHTEYNFSAWIGGYGSQDDSATILLRFLNNNYQIISTQIKLGPVLAINRNYVTKLLFRYQSGLVPWNTRYLIISVMTTRYSGSYCDAYVDNISVIFQYI